MEYRQLARKAGITETTLRAARNGEEIRNATAGKIAAALGVRVDQIMEKR
jgi:DNA-binding Xre family transcriptional regulator